MIQTSHRGSLVDVSGLTFLSLVVLAQFFTSSLQLQACSSKSKARLGGHTKLSRPCTQEKYSN